MMVSDDGLYDPLKPILPYVAGASFTIKQHVPPLPAPRSRTTTDLTCLEPQSGYLQLYGTPSRCCLARPPVSTEPHPDQQTYRLTIVDQLATRDGRGSQVVTCQVGVKKAVRVAKIYDPLYYSWLDGSDAVELAGEHYTNEATAYEVLTEEGHNGDFAPRYLGAWTFEIPLLDGSPRQVRMILMDYVPLPSMMSLIGSGEADAIPPDRRMQMLAQAMENKSWLRFYGVEHGDFAPRNVLVDTDLTNRQPKVIMVDFGRAIVRDLPNGNWFSSSIPNERPEFPGNPFGWSWDEFHEWVPKELRSSKGRMAWIEEQWGGSGIFGPPDPMGLGALEGECR